MAHKIPDQEQIRMMRSKGMSEKDATMKMASMKRAKMKGLKTGAMSPKSLDGQDDYPYGLRIELDHEGMKKLGMKKMPKVGKKHKIVAHAHVTSSSEHSSEGDKEARRSVSMQITHMKLGDDTNDGDEEQGNGKQDQ